MIASSRMASPWLRPSSSDTARTMPWVSWGGGSSMSTGVNARAKVTSLSTAPFQALSVQVAITGTFGSSSSARSAGTSPAPPLGVLAFRTRRRSSTMTMHCSSRIWAKIGRVRSPMGWLPLRAALISVTSSSRTERQDSFSGSIAALPSRPLRAWTMPRASAVLPTPSSPMMTTLFFSAPSSPPITRRSSTARPCRSGVFEGRRMGAPRLMGTPSSSPALFWGCEACPRPRAARGGGCDSIRLGKSPRRARSMDGLTWLVGAVLRMARRRSRNAGSWCPRPCPCVCRSCANSEAGSCSDTTVTPTGPRRELWSKL